MRQVRLGRTDLRVSQIGLGGIPLQRPPEDAAIAMIRRCVALGINFIDTSIAYGTSELRIGKALRGVREQVVVATKCGWKDADTAMDCLVRSLDSLRTEYVDIWQFHNVATMEGYESLFHRGGAMEAAAQAKSEGKVLHLGLSTHSLDVAKEAIASGQFSTIQYPFNLVTPEPEAELLPLSRKHDVGFIAMKPLGGGLLRPARLAIRYLLQFDDLVLDPGIETVSQAEEIAAIADSAAEPLSSKDWDEIDGLRKRLGRRFCRQCGYCLPCPQQIRIPLVMITEVMWNDWPRENFLHWMREAVEGARNCLRCGVCETRCPYELDIRNQLARQVAFFDRVAVAAPD